MTWARILDGQVVETAPEPPSARLNEDGSVTLGVGTDDVTELAAAGWYPVTDDGPHWVDRLQRWDGQPPTLEVTPGGVTAVYAIAEVDIVDLRGEALAAVDAEESAALAALRDAAIDAFLAGGDVPASFGADRQAAQADAEAKRAEVRARKRDDFAGAVVTRPPMTEGAGASA